MLNRSLCILRQSASIHSVSPLPSGRLLKTTPRVLYPSSTNPITKLGLLEEPIKWQNLPGEQGKKLPHVYQAFLDDGLKFQLETRDIIDIDTGSKQSPYLLWIPKELVNQGHQKTIELEQLPKNWELAQFHQSASCAPAV